MFQRICAAWMTYRTRKFLWMLSFLYITFVAIAFIMPVRKSPLWQTLFREKSRPQQVFDSLEEFSNWNPGEIEARRLRCLIIYNRVPGVSRSVKSGEKGGGDSESFTHASERIEGASFTSQDLEKLSKCINLRDVRFTSIDLTPDVGNALAKLPSLSTLEYWMTERSSLENLPPLENLRMLTLFSPKGSELELLQRHAKLRHLKVRINRAPSNAHTPESDINTITLGKVTQLEGLVFNAAKGPFADPLIGEIVKLPSLRHVSIDSDSPVMVGKIRETLAAPMPQVLVQPMTSGIMPEYFQMFSVTPVILALILGLQLLSHAVPFWARTVPRFTAPHVVIAVAFVAIHIVLCILLCVFKEGTLTPLIFLTSLAAPAMTAIGSIMAIRCIGRFPSILPLVPIVCFVAVIVSIAIDQLADPIWVYSLLQGDRPILVWSMIAACFAFIVAGIDHWNRAAAIMAAQNVTYHGDYQAFVQTLLSMRELDSADATKRRRLGQLDRDIAIIENRNSSVSLFTRFAQWNLGYPQNWSKSRSWLPFVGVLLMFLVSFLIGTKTKGKVYDPSETAAVLMFLGMLLAPLVCTGIAMGTHMRRPLLGQELLRPIARSTMSRWLIWSFVSQIWPSILISIGFGIGFAQYTPWLDPEYSSTSYLTLRVGIVCCVATASIWLVNIFILTLPTLWQRHFIGFAIALGLFSCLEFGLIGLASSRAIGLASFALWLIAFATVASLVLGVIGIRRLPNVEWGRD